MIPGTNDGKQKRMEFLSFCGYKSTLNKSYNSLISNQKLVETTQLVALTRQGAAERLW